MSSHAQPPTPKQRPKVAERDRKRAQKACTYCQIRKARCVRTSNGNCVNCSRQRAVCSLQYDNYAKTPATLREPESGPPPRSPAPSSEDVLSSRRSLAFDSSKMPDLIVEDLSSKRLLERLAESMFLSKPSTKTSVMPSRAPNPSAEDPSLNQAKKAFPPRHIADFLCKVCIEYGTDYFFYFSHRQFKDMLNRFYNNPDSFTSLNASFLCMALSCFAIGSQFAHLLDSRLISTESTCLKTLPGRRFYDSAQALVPAMICDPSVESVQALTMLSIYAFPFDTRGASWSYLGLALRLSVSIGLHRDSLDLEMSQVDREIRRRTWWSVYLTERTSSIKLGLPEGISEDAVTTPLPQPCWVLDQGQANNNLELLLACIGLAKIWKAISITVPGVFRPMTPRSIGEINRLVSELETWRASLPDSLNVENISKESKSYRAVVHLHANYHHAWVLLCREPLIAMVRSKMQSSVLTPGRSHISVTHAEDFPGLCLAAAKSILRLYEMLRDADMLARFSFTDFQGCSTSVIIILLYGVVDRDEEYDNLVKFALEALSFMSTGSDKARAAVQFIRAFRELTDEAYNRDQSSYNDAGPTLQDDLSLYKQWMASSEEPHQSQGELAVSVEEAASMRLAINDMSGDNESTSPGISATSPWPNEGMSGAWTSSMGTENATDPLNMDELMNSLSVPETFVADVTGINLLDFGF